MAAMTSHPSRVRGLKYHQYALGQTHLHVAPFTGAWIEISSHPARRIPTVSHPSRVRGLKFMGCRTGSPEPARRTLHGCVD